MTVAKKRGRPQLPPAEGKRCPLNTRTTIDLRRKIEAAAKASGRSIAQEVEHRLEHSFFVQSMTELFARMHKDPSTPIPPELS